MKKKIFIILGVVCIGLIGRGIIQITPERRDKTRNYFQTAQVVLPKNKLKPCCQNLNFEGFSSSNSEGSAFINFLDFKKNLKYAPEKVYVLDLFPEDVYYHKGRPLKWYGIQCTGPCVGQVMEEKRYHKIRKFFIRLANGYPLTYKKEKFQTEQQILKEMGVHHYRPLLQNINWLGDVSYVDDLLKFFETIPLDGHLYVHCENGHGRTTTFLVLYDIFRNGKKVPLQDIVNRHYCIGREDLSNTEPYAKGWWTPEALIARWEFVQRFYEYRTGGNGYPHKTWAQWCREKGIVKKFIQIHR